MSLTASDRRIMKFHCEKERIICLIEKAATEGKLDIVEALDKDLRNISNKYIDKFKRS